jgi:lysyl endopeptidase
MKKTHIFLMFLFVAFITLTTKAQINEGGTPLSFNTKNLSEISFITMPSIDLARLQAEDAINDLNKSIPYRFGENLYTQLNPDNSGVWNKLSNGNIWRLGIKCKDATSMNVCFDKYKLPKGAKLFIYNEEKSFIIGAFTDYNNQTDGMFATTIIPGSSIIIEYFEPFNVEFKGELDLWRVSHGYRGPYANAKGFGESGACERNVVCPEASGWEDQIKGECAIIAGGTELCSGTLINNTSNDGTPYVLTANHCWDAAQNPSNWVFWFNWKSATCTNPTTDPGHQDMSGAVLKAKNAPSDFCLVQLNSTPPSNYNLYYVGWSRSTTPSTSAFCIHHPSVDIMKFSRSLGLRDTVAYGKTSWKARWAWGQVTEPGSSGSAIYDQNHRLVGQLYGGPSSCGAGASDMWDVFGKFDVSWEGGGTSTTRLKDWLDPTNTNVEVLDGYPILAYDAQLMLILIPADSYCSGEPLNVQPKVTIKNRGINNITTATIEYWIDGLNPVSQTWSGTLTTGQTADVTFPNITLTYGNHTFSSKINFTGDLNSANDSIGKSYTVSGGVSLPFTEGFESGTIPTCWSEEVGPPLWEFITGNGGSNPSTAHGGTKNACLKDNNSAPNINKLMLPALDITVCTNPRVTFWHTQVVWGGDQDILTVYYKTSLAGTWTQLEQYTNSITTWTEETINLPNACSTYYLAFEGNAKYGYGVCIDDITVTGDGIGIDEQVFNSKVNVYPNPNNGNFTVELNSEMPENISIKIVNMLGTTEFEKDNITVNGFYSTILDLNSLSNGIYYLRVQGDKKIITKKIIIKK